jgi:glycosyltransferase involved in cell wall biosynthesis
VNILFLHQNTPGQFRHLAPALAADPSNTVLFVGKRGGVELPGVRTLTYTPVRAAHPDTHQYVRTFEDCVLHGQQVARIGLELRREGFQPDVVIAHPAWGEALFVKDVFPVAALLNYCEFYYHGTGADVGFDPEAPADIDTRCRVRSRNAHLLLSLEACDRGISPTHWQRSQHPWPMQSKIEVIFDGIDVAVASPDPGAGVRLPDGLVLTRETPVVTYVARNLEPYRGFHSFMRALPAILAGEPHAHAVIIGGDEVSYGSARKDGLTWRAALTEEAGLQDHPRVHFLGRVPYELYLAVLRVSAVHVYLTVPFVLSWSCLEAMSCGCIVLGSRTPPVEEVIRDGENGFLVDFFAPGEIASRTLELIRQGSGLDTVRRAARASVSQTYRLDRCLAQQMALVRSLVP